MGNGTGVFLSNASSTNGGVTGDVVEGNYIGTDANSDSGIGNVGDGVLIDHGSDGNTIGGTTPAARNIISGNTDSGVTLAQGTGANNNAVNSNVVEGNYIGTDVSGNNPLPNGTVGVAIEDVNGNTIGGTAAGAGNVISGNSASGSLNEAGGVSISGGSTSNVIQGNDIGTNASGNSPLPNTGIGVLIDSSNANTVGGAAPGAGNIISGNASVGVKITNLAASNGGVNSNVVQGNYIGTNASSADNLGNHNQGVVIDYGSDGNTVGGTATGDRNVISGNGEAGVVLSTGATGIAVNSNVVQGNLIGTNVNGTGALANGSNGLEIIGSNDNTVGGAAAGAGNTISGNTGSGVSITASSTENVVQGNDILDNSIDGVTVGSSTSDASTTGNLIIENVITGNAGLGIDLGGDGDTNNGASGHSGPNDVQDFPTLTGVSSSGAATTVTGTFTETNEPNSSLQIAFYADPTADPTQHGQAASFLGTTTITTNGSGQVPSFSASGLTLSGGPVPVGDVVTATANVVSSSAAGIVVNDTSEFSADLAVVAPPAATTQAATSITTTGATLSASVNPEGGATTVTFVYGTSPTLTSGTTTPVQSIGSGTSAQAVPAPVTGLTADTTYFFEVEATNAGGTTIGSILSFTTIAVPSATTTAATAVTTTGATLTASVDPDGSATTVTFAYGTSPTLTTSTTTTAQSVGSGTGGSGGVGAGDRPDGEHDLLLRGERDQLGRHHHRLDPQLRPPRSPRRRDDNSHRGRDDHQRHPHRERQP